MDIIAAKEQVIRAGRELVAKGLVARTWGNVSCRADGDRFAITPSGIGYERLTADLIVAVDVRDGSYQGDVAPSSEHKMHAAIYSARPDVDFIIHTHQTYATCMSIAGPERLAPTAEETERLGGPIGIADYAFPGTGKLKDNVAKAIAEKGGVVLMKRHGVIAVGDNPDTAFARATLLEEVAKREMPGIAYAAGAPAASASRPAGEDGRNGSGADERIAPYAEAIFARRADVSQIVLLDTPSTAAVMDGRRKVPALIDDYAFIVGPDAKVAEPVPEKAAAALGDRSAVFARGLGALCCAAERSDAEAIMMLIEKNVMSLRAAGQYGTARPIPYWERLLLRKVYVSKYSKKK
ncbi:MAG: class II aldolase/adducin family protein [Clostridiales Family XIII bacterium]|jgi:L-fuculose-phosphate aldolase|nr:class II aldolase/adducin family protein [Clostridiales Family XIII bacterium]